MYSRTFRLDPFLSLLCVFLVARVLRKSIFPHFRTFFPSAIRSYLSRSSFIIIFNVGLRIVLYETMTQKGCDVRSAPPFSIRRFMAKFNLYSFLKPEWQAIRFHVKKSMKFRNRQCLISDTSRQNLCRSRCRWRERRRKRNSIPELTCH